MASNGAQEAQASRSSTDQHNQHDQLREPLLPPPSDNSSSSTPSGHGDTAQVRLVDGMPLGTSILLKSLYFLEALGSSAWGRFATIYYNGHGLDPSQIGLIEGLMPVVRAVSQPFWGGIADTYHCRKLVYLITRAGSTVILLTLSLPWVYGSWIRMLYVTLSTRLFEASGVLDAYTLDLLGTENRMKYGRYRLWAGASWGLGSIVIGFITDRYGFEPNFIIFGILAAITLVLIAWKIPDKVREDTGRSTNDETAESDTVMDLIKLAISPRVSGFMVINVVMGMGMATVERLLFLYLVNDLGASNLLCGISVGVSVMTEIPVFWHAERIMKALGHDGMMAVSMICFFTRVFGYTLLTPATKLWVLPLEATHGVTFALFWSASTDVTKALINRAKGWNTTIPILVQTLYTSVGVGLGSVLGGLLMKEWGSREMYRCVAAMVLVLFILHIVASAISRAVFKHPFLPDHDDSIDTTVDASDQRGNHEEGDDDTERQSFCDEEGTDGV